MGDVHQDVLYDEYLPLLLSSTTSAISPRSRLLDDGFWPLAPRQWADAMEGVPRGLNATAGLVLSGAEPAGSVSADASTPLPQNWVLSEPLLACAASGSQAPRLSSHVESSRAP